MSISIENFVKAIYLQEQRMGEDTRPGTLSKLLNITNAATTDMARNLSEKKLVNYTKYQKLSLTPEGKKLALNVLRKHRLWEAFLHKTLDLSLHEIHLEAEKLEHLTSDFLADRIDKYLNYPASDPHGDPIPCSEGIETPKSDAIVLSDNILSVTNIESASSAFAASITLTPIGPYPRIPIFRPLTSPDCLTA